MKNKLGIGVLSVCFIAAFTAVLPAQSLTGVTREAIDQYIAQGDDAAAQAALLEALAQDNFPDKDWAGKQYFAVAERRGVLAAAVVDLEQKAAMSPADDVLQLNVAEGHARMKNWDKVVGIYENLSRKHPNDSVLSSRLKNFYMLSGNYEGVIRAYEPVVRDNPDDIEASDALLNAYTKAGKSAQAIELFKARLEKAPGSAGLRGRYAQALMDFGRLEEAAAQWQKAFELDPKNMFFKQKLGETYLALENYGQAKKEFQELDRKAPDNQPWFRNVASGQLQAIEEKTRSKKR